MLFQLASTMQIQLNQLSKEDIIIISNNNHSRLTPIKYREAILVSPSFSYKTCM